MAVRFAIVAFSTIVAASCGCTLAPKSFIQSNDPAPLVRARALTMGRGLPDEQAIPRLIAQLDDEDAVVRMVAIEELKNRTGQDFGYLPYGAPPERAQAAAAWHNWWRQTRGRAYASSQQPSPQSTVTPTARRRGLFRRR